MLATVGTLLDPFLFHPQVELPVLRISGAGFDVLWQGTPAVVLRWHEVSEIVAYEKDLLESGEICLAFGRAEPGDWVEISEAWPGFGEVTDAMQQVFPTIPGRWRRQFAASAGETFWRALYQRYGLEEQRAGM